MFASDFQPSILSTSGFPTLSGLASGFPSLLQNAALFPAAGNLPASTFPLLGNPAPQAQPFSLWSGQVPSILSNGGSAGGTQDLFNLGYIFGKMDADGDHSISPDEFKIYAGANGAPAQTDAGAQPSQGQQNAGQSQPGAQTQSSEATQQPSDPSQPQPNAQNSQQPNINPAQPQPGAESQQQASTGTASVPPQPQPGAQTQPSPNDAANPSSTQTQSPNAGQNSDETGTLTEKQQTDLDALKKKIEAENKGPLTPEQQTRFDALKKQLAAENAKAATDKSAPGDAPPADSSTQEEAANQNANEPGGLTQQQQTDLDALKKKIEAKNKGPLTPEQQTRFDALKKQLKAENAKAATDKDTAGSDTDEKKPSELQALWAKSAGADHRIHLKPLFKEADTMGGEKEGEGDGKLNEEEYKVFADLLGLKIPYAKLAGKEDGIAQKTLFDTIKAADTNGDKVVDETEFEAMNAAALEEKPPEDVVIDVADDKAADDKVADNQPADDKAADDKAADDKMADNQPADDKAADDKVADNQPADDKVADDKAAEDQQTDAQKAADTSAANAKPNAEKLPTNEKEKSTAPASQWAKGKPRYFDLNQDHKNGVSRKELGKFFKNHFAPNGTFTPDALKVMVAKLHWDKAHSAEAFRDKLTGATKPTSVDKVVSTIFDARNVDKDNERNSGLVRRELGDLVKHKKKKTT